MKSKLMFHTVLLACAVLGSTAYADYYYYIYPGMSGSNFPAYRTATQYQAASSTNDPAQALASKNQINLTFSNGALLGSGATFWNIMFFEGNTSSRGAAMDSIMANPLSKVSYISLQCKLPVPQYNGGYYLQNFYEVGAAPGIKNCFISNVQINN